MLLHKPVIISEPLGKNSLISCVVQIKLQQLPGLYLQVFVNGVHSEVFRGGKNGVYTIFSQFVDNKPLFKGEFFSDDLIINLLDRFGPVVDQGIEFGVFEEDDHQQVVFCYTF